jgi:hypothetical protein
MPEDQPKPPTVAPPPSDIMPDTERPNARTDPMPEHAIPDRTDEVLAALHALGQRVADLALQIEFVPSQVTASREAAERAQHSSAQALEASQECRRELRQSHTWLDEWAKQTAYDLDKRFDAMTTQLHGLLRAVSADVTAQKHVIQNIAHTLIEHRADFHEHGELVETLAKRSYDLAKGGDDERERPTVAGSQLK